MGSTPTSAILVLIPAFNEEATVADVVGAARQRLGCDVLVVDDGSSDATVLQARRAGAMVIRHPLNLGVGGAIRTGMRVALSLHKEYVVQLDADGQHDADDAELLLKSVMSGECDIAVGSRFESGYEASTARAGMMRLLSRWISRRVDTTITDTTSGFRAFGPRAIALFSRSYPTMYLSDTVEALLLASDTGLTIREQAVQMHPRMGGTPSSGRVRSAVRLARLWLVLFLHPIRRPATPRGVSNEA
jgi:glycosyltransferase involved in cell wall biosynthesis